jgi:SAM-dependent methyltransferase
MLINEREHIMAQSPSPQGILQLGMAFFGSKTLLSAVELGLFTELANGPLSLEALKARLGLHERGARDFLDTLVAFGILDRNDGLYANRPETDYYLDRNKPTYVGGILEMANTRLYGFWARLTTALRTGKPQNEVADGQAGLFETLYADPARLEGFLKAMSGISLPTARAIAAAFPWNSRRTFADIGCAQGAFPAEIALAHPHLEGIGFDLAPVQPIFERYVESRGLAARLKFQAGDFFAGALPTVDVLVMGHILHDWDLDTKMMLLRKAHAALPDGGALLVYEALIDDERRSNAFGLLMSLNMLIETPGGFDYTGADCMGWMREAGFRETRVERLPGSDGMVIGIK